MMKELDIQRLSGIIVIVGMVSLYEEMVLVSEDEDKVLVFVKILNIYEYWINHWVNQIEVVGIFISCLYTVYTCNTFSIRYEVLLPPLCQILLTYILVEHRSRSEIILLAQLDASIHLF